MELLYLKCLQRMPTESELSQTQKYCDEYESY